MQQQVCGEFAQQSLALEPLFLSFLRLENLFWLVGSNKTFFFLHILQMKCYLFFEMTNEPWKMGGLKLWSSVYSRCRVHSAASLTGWMVFSVMFVLSRGILSNKQQFKLCWVLSQNCCLVNDNKYSLLIFSFDSMYLSAMQGNPNKPRETVW